jgi:hypothetical protein
MAIVNEFKSDDERRLHLESHVLNRLGMTPNEVSIQYGSSVLDGCNFHSCFAVLVVIRWKKEILSLE